MENISEHSRTGGYYDLDQKIKDEQAALRAVIDFQKRGKILVDEKEIQASVSEFKKDVGAKVKAGNFLSHFNLGIALSEQGLLDEAISQFEIAAEDSDLLVECFGLIAGCFDKKNDPGQAISWMQRTLELAPRKDFPSSLSSMTWPVSWRKQERNQRP